MSADIERLDRYTLLIDGVWVTASEDQERVLRALSPEQLENFLRVMDRTRGES